MSARMDLDFVRPRVKPQRVLAWAALAGAAALAVWSADRHAQLAAESDALQSRHEVLRARLQGRTGTTPALALDPTTQQRVGKAQTIVARLALPWEDLFGAIEAADSRRLALLALEPNARESTLRISGEAASTTELLAYVDRLARQPVLSQVHLVSYETVQREGAAVVSFNVQARWNSP